HLRTHLGRLRQRHTVHGRYEDRCREGREGQIGCSESLPAKVRAPIGEHFRHKVELTPDGDLVLQLHTRPNLEHAPDHHLDRRPAIADGPLLPSRYAVVIEAQRQRRSCGNRRSSAGVCSSTHSRICCDSPIGPSGVTSTGTVAPPPARLAANLWMPCTWRSSR